MSFEPAFKLPSAVSADALWFVYRQDRLLLKRSNSSCHIPDTRDLKTTNLSPTRNQYLGALDGRECYAAELPDIDPDLDGFDLVGFLADYDSGEIHVNRSEIVEAGWFRALNLPSIPPRITIARHLIDWFVHQQFPTTPRTPLGR